MASRAYGTFELGLNRATVLYNTVGLPALRPQSRSDAEAILHAALASATAAWNFYVPNVIRDFRDAIADPLDVRFSAMHTTMVQVGDVLIGKFNTPNAENSRNIIISLTGYDPISDWIWPQRGFSGLATRDRLNEILKVRHSFAHGFAIPPYSWTQASNGRVALRKEAVGMTFAFLKNLTRRTDAGIANHLQAVYSAAFR